MATTRKLGHTKGAFGKSAFTRKSVSLLLFLASTLPGLGATVTWTGGGGNDTWSTGANWSTGTPPQAGDALVFTGLSAAVTANILADSYSGLLWNSTAESFNIFIPNDQELRLTGDVVNESFTIQQLIGTVVALDNLRFTTGAYGTLLLEGTLTGENVVITFDGEGTVLVDSQITELAGGSVSLFKDGPGELHLSASNSYSGGTVIHDGIVDVWEDGALGSGTVVIHDGATLHTNQAISVSTPIVASGSGSGTGAIVAKGSHFTGSITLAGDTLFNTGLLDDSYFTGPLDLGQNHQLSLIGNTILSGQISGTGNLIANGGYTELSGNLSNTFRGDVVLNNNATLELAKTGGAIAIPGDVHIHSGRLATLESDQFSTETVIHLHGPDAKLDFGTTTRQTIAGLSGSQGAIYWDSSISNAELILAGSGTYSLSIAINQGKGTPQVSITKVGTGTQTLGPYNYFNGTVTLENGLLIGSGAGAFGSGTLVLKGGTLGTTGATFKTFISIESEVAYFDVGFQSEGAINHTGTMNLNGEGRTFVFQTGTANPISTFGGSIQNDNGGGLILRNADPSLPVYIALGGTLANTYTGTTVVGDGMIVYLSKEVGAVPGDLVIEEGGQVSLARTSALGSNSRVDLYGKMRFTYSGTTGTFASLNGTGVLEVAKQISAPSNASLIIREGNFAGNIRKDSDAISLLLQKTGTGTLLLSGSNQIDTLEIRGGVLEIQSPEAFGTPQQVTFQSGTLRTLQSLTVDAPVTISGAAGATLQVAGGMTLTLNGDLSGQEPLYINDVEGHYQGTVVFNGVSTDAGFVFVPSGKLVVNGTMSSTDGQLFVSGELGGTGYIDYTTWLTDEAILSAGNSPGTLRVRSLMLSADSILRFELDTPNVPGGLDNDLVMVDDLLWLGGHLEITGGSLFNTGTYTLFTVGGPLIGETDIGKAPAGYSYLLQTGNGKVNLIVDYEGVQWWNGEQTTADGTIHGGDGIWNNNTTNWTDQNGGLAHSWSNLVARFSGSSGTVTVAEDVVTSGLQFVIDGYTLTGTGRLVMGENGLEIFVNPAANATIETVITGTGNLLKNGDGTAILLGTNTYVGETILNRGALVIDTDAILGDSGNGLTLAGGTLAITGDTESHRLVTLQNGGGAFDIAGHTTLSGQITGTGNLLKSGGGTLVLTQSNSYIGSTTLASGTLVLNADANLGHANNPLFIEDGVLHIVQDFTTQRLIRLNNHAVIDTVGSLSILGYVDGEGGIVKRGSGTLYLSGAHGYEGSTRLEEGILAIDSDASLGNPDATLTLAGGMLSILQNGISTRSIILEADSTIETHGIFQIGGVISGTGNLDKRGGGILALANGTNSFVGNVTVAEGGLALASDEALGHEGNELHLAGGTLYLSDFALSHNIVLDGGGTLSVTGTALIEAVISGTGPLVSNGIGKIVLNHANTFAGDVTIEAGTILINDDNRLGDAANSVILAGGHLEVEGDVVTSRDITLDNTHIPGSAITSHGLFEVQGSVTGTGNLAKGGTGTLVLAGPVDYTGHLQIAEGAVVFRTDTSLLTGQIINHGELVFEQSVNSSFANVISGSGSLVQQGTALLDLSGATLAYSGNTVVNSGTLATGSLPTSTLILNGGAYSPGAIGEIASVTVQGLEVNGGIFHYDLDYLGVGDNITVSNGAAVLAGTAHFVFSTDATFGIFPLITGLNGQWDLSFLSFEGLSDPDAQLFLNPAQTILYLSLDGVPVTGPVLQNSDPINTPKDALFLVSGDVTTGTPSEDNQVALLYFENGGSLQVHNHLSVVGGTLTVLSGTGYLHGNVLVAPNGLTIGGNGELVTNIDFQVSGNTTISSGTFIANGQISGDTVLVQPGAVLGGNALITGNLVNHGILKPGNSPGTVTVDGDYIQTGAFELEIAGKKNFDRLIVGGNASLSGTLTVIPYGGYQLKHGQKFTFLEAGSISGAFDKTILPGGFRPRFLEDDGDLTLLLAPESYTQMAVTPNQKNLAKALDRFIDAKGDRGEVSIALDHLSADEYPAAFEEILPSLYASLGNITLEQSFSQGQMLQQRFGTTTLAPRGFVQSGVNLPVVAEKSTGKKDIMLATGDNPWGVWVQGNGLFAHATLSNIPNYHQDSGGFLIGADYQWNDSFATGLYAGYQNTVARYDGDGRTDIDATRFGAYATYVSGNGFYANATVGGGVSRYTVRRNIDFGDLHRTTRSTPSGGEFSTMLGAGYDWKLGGFSIGPVASAQYTYVKVNSVTERGAKSLDLKVDAHDLNSLRTTLGGRIAYTWLPTPDIAIIPELRATWQHEYLRGSQSLWATLDGGTGPGFQYIAASPERNSLYAGAGINFLFGSRWSANVYYNLNAGGGDFKSHMVSAGVNVSF